MGKVKKNLCSKLVVHTHTYNYLTSELIISATYSWAGSVKGNKSRFEQTIWKFRDYSIENSTIQ